MAVQHAIEVYRRPYKRPAGFTRHFDFGNLGCWCSAPNIWRVDHTLMVGICELFCGHLYFGQYKDLDPKFGESIFCHFSARGALLHICAWYDPFFSIIWEDGSLCCWRVVSESHSAAARKFLCLESDHFRSSLISNSVQNQIKDIVISWSWLTLPSMIEVEHDPKGSTSWVPKPSSTSMMGGRPGCNWNIFQPCEGSRNRRGNLKAQKSTNPNLNLFFDSLPLVFQGVLKRKKHHF